MVVAVLGGQLVDGFLGAMPEAQVRQWLSQVMGVAEKMGMRSADGEAGQAGQADQDLATERARTGAPGNRTRGPASPAGARTGPGAGLPPAYAEARAAMERGDLDGAAKAFEEELARSPGDPFAK